MNCCTLRKDSLATPCKTRIEDCLSLAAAVNRSDTPAAADGSGAVERAASRSLACANLDIATVRWPS